MARPDLFLFMPRGSTGGWSWPSILRHSTIFTALPAVALSLPASMALATVLDVTGGQTVATVGPRTFDSVLVTGTSAQGDRSTYTATGSLTLTDSAAAAVTVSDSGLMVASGGVTAAGFGDISTGGTFVANSATSFDTGFFVYDGGELRIGSSGSITTPAGQYFYLAGAGAFTRTAGGSYSAGVLSIADGAAVDFVSGDSVGGDVLIDTGSTLAIATPLVTSGTLYLANGGGVTRSSQTITVDSVTLTGASSFQSIAGDSIQSASVGGGSTFTMNAALELAGLTVSGDDGLGGPSAFIAAAPLTISSGGNVQVSNGGFLAASAAVTGDGVSSSLTVSGSGSTLSVFAPVSAFDSVAIDTGGFVELASGTIASGSLAISGSLAFDRTSGTYETDSLSLADGAAVDYGASDTITTNAVVGSAATLELKRDLTLTGALTLADGGAIIRVLESIDTQTLTVTGLSTLALLPTDQVGQLSLSGGGGVSTVTQLELASLSITDAGSLLTLGAFDGVNGDLRYALRVYGDVQTQLSAYLVGGEISLGPAPQTPGVVYDVGRFGNFTYVGYVVAVPEPSTIVFFLGSLLTAIPLLRRRARLL